MNNDSLIRLPFTKINLQVRYMRRVLGEAPRNEDGQIVIDDETEADLKDSLNRMEEILTGRPRN